MRQDRPAQASKNETAPSKKARRVYHPPRLTKYGPLSTLTLGGSPGTGDSGGGVLIENPIV